MPDVQLHDLRQRRDRLGGRVIETVARVNFEAERMRKLRARDDAQRTSSKIVQ